MYTHTYAYNLEMLVCRRMADFTTDGYDIYALLEAVISRVKKKKIKSTKVRY